MNLRSPERSSIAGRARALPHRIEFPGPHCHVVRVPDLQRHLRPQPACEIRRRHGPVAHHNSRGEEQSMANLSPPARAERRIPEKVSVVLYSFENTAHESTSTINVSRHGVCLLTRAFWVPDRDVSVRSVTGRLYSRAHVVYCNPLSDSFYSDVCARIQTAG